MNLFQEILDWSEVWASFLALAICILFRSKSHWTRPVFYFLLLTFIFSSALDLIWQRKRLGLDAWFQDNLWWWYETDPATGKVFLKNTIFYNLNSITRLIFFTWFFRQFLLHLKKTTFYFSGIALVIIGINFLFFKSIKDFSSLTHTLESGVLLYYCFRFFYLIHKDDEIDSPFSLPHYWVALGLAFYSSINFMIFLFYEFLMRAYNEYAGDIWNIHNISFILLCLLTSIGLYKEHKKGIRV